MVGGATNDLGVLDARGVAGRFFAGDAALGMAEARWRARTLAEGVNEPFDGGGPVWYVLLDVPGLAGDCA
jgi:hypothetical protein